MKDLFEKQDKEFEELVMDNEEYKFQSKPTLKSFHSKIREETLQLVKEVIEKKKKEIGYTGASCGDNVENGKKIALNDLLKELDI